MGYRIKIEIRDQVDELIGKMIGATPEDRACEIMVKLQKHFGSVTNLLAILGEESWEDVCVFSDGPDSDMVYGEDAEVMKRLKP